VIRAGCPREGSEFRIKVTLTMGWRSPTRVFRTKSHGLGCQEMDGVFKLKVL